MFSYICKKLKLMKNNAPKSNTNNSYEEPKFPSLSIKLQENLNNLRNILGSSSDVIYREFSFGSKMQLHAAIVYLDGMTQKATINEMIIKPLMYDSKLFDKDNILELGIMEVIKNGALSIGNVSQSNNVSYLIDACLSGNTLFLMDGSDEAIIISTEGWETRGVEESKTEAVVRGPREGFCENLLTNMTLLRRKIKNANLTFETMTIGTQTKTNVCVAYLKGVVNSKLISEVKERLNNINIDSVLESGYIEQLIEDAPHSIFPTVGNSEKPDTAAAKILEGRVAILVDGTPFVLTLPMLFIEGFQSAEDYYSRPYFASVLRTLRLLSFLISILAPTTYVVLSTFHQELIPSTLLFTMMSARESVPFPAVMEAALMIITFEILREAGVRLPRPVGQAVSIVGALVIGEAAVSAGLVGGLMVIVVALTAVSSFVIPVYTDVCSILRIMFLILGSTLGIFGVGIGVLVLMVHTASLRSFGTPYLSPIAPLNTSGLMDTFMRKYLWKMDTRPSSIVRNNLRRQSENQKPESPKQKDQT